ncbi:MAG: ATPase, T2SS/T4P/T4SS family [Thermoplasmatota archaeon]
MTVTLVPDTSVLVDGRMHELLAEPAHADARVVIPRAALAELEAQANRGQETGFAGLDELRRLQRAAEAGDVRVEIFGERPGPAEIAAAGEGAIDAAIRDVAAAQKGGVLVTSDRVQAYAAAAAGVEHLYLRPVVDDPPAMEQLALWRFFDDDVMSVHLKADCIPMVKRGTPAGLSYEPAGGENATRAPTPIAHEELRALSREAIEFAKRDYNSFIELERHGCTVIQMGPMRVTLAQPPFADGLEVTAVRPVVKLGLDDYDLPEEVLERALGKSRGVFIAGPPGSGKSTFAAALAEHLHGLDRVVKTMEQPRDLQVPKEVTQYGALDRDMQWTGEVMLLVRPDHVVYDEVRTTGDFRVFADMRMAGIGLFGVTHASRAIDAVQRLIGRVELGMIPQVVDTVVFIDEGAVAQVLELTFTVRVPSGMMQEDLARPVVVVTDLQTRQECFELYTYGEQVVVMPLDGGMAGAPGVPAGRRRSGASALAERELNRALRRYVHGPFEVQVNGNRASVFVDQEEVPSLIGKGGKTVQGLERRLGIRLDVRPRERGKGGGKRAQGGSAGSGGPRGGPGEVRVKKTGSNLFVLAGPGYGSQEIRVLIEGSEVAAGLASKDGKLRFKANTPEAKAIASAVQAGLILDVEAL